MVAAGAKPEGGRSDALPESEDDRVPPRQGLPQARDHVRPPAPAPPRRAGTARGVVKPRYARWLVIAAAAVAVLVAAAGREDPEARAEEPELVLRYLFSPDADDLLVPLIDRFNGESHRFGRPRDQDRRRLAHVRRGRSGTRRRPRASRALDACVLALGRAPRPQRLGRLGARRESSTRLLAAGDRDVEAARPGARLAARRRSAGSDILALTTSKRQLGSPQAPQVREVQARAHEPRLLDVGALGRRVALLRRHRQAVGPECRGRPAAGGPRRRPEDRGLDRALRRDRRPADREDEPPRHGLCPCGVRPGDDLARAQQQAAAGETAGRDRARRRHLRRRLSAHSTQRSVGDPEGAGGGAAIPPVARPEDHAGARDRERLPFPPADRPHRARAAEAGGARRDPGRVARGSDARQHRSRRGHVVVDG